MHVRNLVWSLVVLGACGGNPRPTPPTIEMMERQGLGGQVVVTTHSGAAVNGELIAVDAARVYVLQRPLRPGAFVAIDLRSISSANLFRYEPQGGLGTWGLVGALSTLSHGFVLVLSAPTWLVTAGVVSGFEQDHIVMSYPKTTWREISMWARFPQGLPPNVDERSLIYATGMRAR